MKKIFVLLSCVFLLTACDHKSKKSKIVKTQTIVASLQTPVKKLYFTGTLFPISTSAVISPVAGNISAVNFTYGERVKEAQELLIINSKPLSHSYRTAVSDYLTKKQAYVTQESSFQGTQVLYKAGVIARNDYVSAQTAYDNAKLDFLQSKFALEKVLRTANVDSEKIESLSISDTTEVNAILERRFQHIEIAATGSGVALFPTAKVNSVGGSTSGKLTVGDAVKEGDLLLSIGDLTGLSAAFDVSEVDIDRIHKDMAVIVTGSAFPGAELKGTVTAVSVQASQGGGGGGGLSMFSVKIDIPKVDPKVMDKIRVGMTAKFEIDIKGAPHIMLPVNAVSQLNGNNVVMILGANGKSKAVPVLVGDTSPTQIVIINGVNVGDKILVPIK